MVIELSEAQFGLKSYAWFQNRTSAQREFDLKSQVWFRTKISQHEVQLPLYYTHFEIARIQYKVSSNILLMQYLAGLRLNSSIFWGEKMRVLETKVAKFATWYSLSFKPWNLIGCFVLSIASLLAGKKMRFKAKKMVRRDHQWIQNKCNKLHYLRQHFVSVISHVIQAGLSFGRPGTVLTRLNT